MTGRSRVELIAALNVHSQRLYDRTSLAERVTGSLAHDAVLRDSHLPVRYVVTHEMAARARADRLECRMLDREIRALCALGEDEEKVAA
jgi:hypothetical protein